MAERSSIPHLLDLQDLSDQEVDDLLDLSTRIKRRAGAFQLTGKTIGLLFFRPSLRTRASFEAAVNQLGAQAIHLTASSDFWELESQDGAVMDGRAPEHVKDAARVLSRYVSALAIRPALTGQSWAADRRDASIRAWAQHAQVPVINMESALWHPLQALADLMTLRETLGELRGKTLSVVWTRSPQPASHSAVHSLVLAALRSGMNVRVAHPSGYELDEEVLALARGQADAKRATFETGQTVKEAVKGAHIVYARSWSSLEDYGNPTLAASRRGRTQGWIVDENLMKLGADARLMHAGPVRRNLEVTDDVLDGARSLVYEQAENRLHSQKALLARLLRA